MHVAVPFLADDATNVALQTSKSDQQHNIYDCCLGTC